jgi:hypothetical protein
MTGTTLAAVVVAAMSIVLRPPTPAAAAAVEPQPPAIVPEKTTAPLTVPAVPQGLPVAAPPPSRAQWTPLPCATQTVSENGPFYPGPSSSYVYDQTFTKSYPIPYLPDLTPQGMTMWPKWFSDGSPMLVLGMYSDGDAYLVGLDPTTGGVFGTVRVDPAHLGGIGIVGNWLIAQDEAVNGGESVRKYRLQDLAAAFEQSRADGSKPFVKRWGGLQKVYYASFMAVHNNHIWAGHHGGGIDKMYEYSVSDDGTLVQVGGAWEVPPKIDGLVVTDDRFIFSSASGTQQSDMTVSMKTPHLADGHGRCFRTPSMTEGMAMDGDQVFLTFESASARYPDAINRVANLHTAPYAKLSALLNPPPR